MFAKAFCHKVPSLSLHLSISVVVRLADTDSWCRQDLEGSALPAIEGDNLDVTQPDPAKAEHVEGEAANILPKVEGYSGLAKLAGVLLVVIVLISVFGMHRRRANYLMVEKSTA